MTANLSFSEAELIASVCRKSYKHFVLEFWDTIIQEPVIWNWHLDKMCADIQEVCELMFQGKAKTHDLIWNVSPASTKSTLFSVMLCPWIWTRMPHCRFMGATHTDDLGKTLSTYARDILVSDKYRAAFPEIRIRDDANTQSFFKNTKGGWRRFYTVGGKSPTGQHAHIQVIDDPIDPERAMSDQEINKANRFCSNTMSSRKVDKEKSPSILVMQRLHQNDPTGYLSGKKWPNVKHRIIPARMAENLQPKSWKRYYRKGLMDPIRLSERALKEAEAQGVMTYATQYQQTPTPPGGIMFKPEEIIVEDAAPISLIRHMRFWDKAATHDDGAYTVGVKMALQVVPGLEEPLVWVLDVVRGQWETATREKIILNTAMRDGKRVLIGMEEEPGSSGKDSIRASVMMLCSRGFRAAGLKATGDKVTRADPYAGYMNSGAVRMVRADWNDAYVDELKYFPRSTYKDQVDASSGCFAQILKGYRMKRRKSA